MDKGVRMAILTAYEKVICFADNSVPDALHFWDFELHTYLQGAAYTLSVTFDRTDEDAQAITEGCKISFKLNGRDYYLNVMTIEWSEGEIIVTATGLSFELIQETTDPLDSAARSFEDYVKLLGAETANVRIQSNDIYDRKIACKWEGEQTLLARLFSLAGKFDAEIEFVTILNNDYSLKEFVMNVYAAGVGRDRTDEILKVGRDLTILSRKSDISELYTAIRPTGTDGLTLQGFNEHSSDYPVVGIDIHAPDARDRFPSTLSGADTDRYVVALWSYETTSRAMLYGQAKAELKKHCVPRVEYQAEGMVDGEIGDRFTIADESYQPDLYVECRVTEQIYRLPDWWNSSTVFDNYTEVRG